MLSVENFNQITKYSFDKLSTIADLHIKLKLCEYVTTLLCQHLKIYSNFWENGSFSFN